MTPNRYQGAILYALNLLANGGRRHIYGGTVPDAVVASRRRKDKAAKAARKTHRRAR